MPTPSKPPTRRAGRWSPQCEAWYHKTEKRGPVPGPAKTPRETPKPGPSFSISSERHATRPFVKSTSVPILCGEVRCCFLSFEAKGGNFFESRIEKGAKPNARSFPPAKGGPPARFLKGF